MDMTESLEAKSDQLNAVDLLGGPRTFTIQKVTSGSSSEQPFNFHLAELPGKPWRANKGMRRILARGWGAKNIETVYIGRRVTLFCEPEVLWAGAPVGGIRISHMSDIGDGFSTPLAISKTKRISYRVDPLPDAPPAPSEPTPQELAEQLVAALADATTEAEVREWGNRAHARGLLDLQVKAETVKSHVEYRLAEVKAAAEVSPEDAFGAPA